MRKLICRAGLSILPLLFFVALSTGCVQVRPYRRARINDCHMRLGKMKIEKTDEEMHAYREGAAGGNGKASGGCGCN